ncbi:MAG TPA: lipid-A-disaccharide synthase N-terminal domain-containing protein [Candidatus Synoicihabitans sp.]|nr:lipid-A-disaccharide synthase N-terminal domain-containing protein [Candidatus Synoicihabitans sp.]
MNNEILRLSLGGIEVLITPWKLIGYLGVLLFGGRWVVQLAASKLARRPVVPGLFWYMSLLGSVLLLGYFALGKNDSVGVLSNLFPAFVAAYNLILHRRHAGLADQAVQAAIGSTAGEPTASDKAARPS